MAPVSRHPAVGLLLALLVAVACSFALGCGVEYPNCNGDNDCTAHREHCVNGHCQQCRNQADCPGGHTCLRNRCVPGLNACEGDNDCLRTQRCVANHCVPRGECDEHRACPSNRPCVAGVCTEATTGEDEDPHDNRGRMCTFEPVYFAFDNATLDEGSRRALQAAADCLRRETNSRYVLIGRADPRGTTEYNLALGERRARTAQSYLTSLGVQEARIAVSSEGAEAATGTDDASWSRDRRVDFRPRD